MIHDFLIQLQKESCTVDLEGGTINKKINRQVNSATMLHSAETTIYMDSFISHRTVNRNTTCLCRITDQPIQHECNTNDDKQQSREVPAVYSFSKEHDTKFDFKFTT
ncbi:hypothetical protein CBL_14099 [Carabus blaptoides fortunei]